MSAKGFDYNKLISQVISSSESKTSQFVNLSKMYMISR